MKKAKAENNLKRELFSGHLALINIEQNSKSINQKNLKFK